MFEQSCERERPGGSNDALRRVTNTSRERQRRSVRVSPALARRRIASAGLTDGRRALHAMAIAADIATAQVPRGGAGGAIDDRRVIAGSTSGVAAVERAGVVVIAIERSAVPRASASDTGLRSIAGIGIGAERSVLHVDV